MATGPKTLKFKTLVETEGADKIAATIKRLGSKRLAADHYGIKYDLFRTQTNKIGIGTPRKNPGYARNPYASNAVLQRRINMLGSKDKAAKFYGFHLSSFTQHCQKENIIVEPGLKSITLRDLPKDCTHIDIVEAIDLMDEIGAADTADYYNVSFFKFQQFCNDLNVQVVLAPSSSLGRKGELVAIKYMGEFVEQDMNIGTTSEYDIKDKRLNRVEVKSRNLTSGITRFSIRDTNWCDYVVCLVFDEEVCLGFLLFKADKCSFNFKSLDDLFPLSVLGYKDLEAYANRTFLSIFQ